MPIFNDFEDNACHMICPDNSCTYLEQTEYCKITDSTTSDHYVFNNQTQKPGLTYKQAKKLHRAMWHPKAEHLRRWLIRHGWSDETKDEARKLIKKVLELQNFASMKQPHGRPKDFGIKVEFPNGVVVMDQAFLKGEEFGN